MKHSNSSGVFLHASAVIVDGGAVLFLGHSTAGKSTISRLLGAVCPVLADDTVFAWRTEGGEWRVADGKFRFEQPLVSESTPNTQHPTSNVQGKSPEHRHSSGCKHLGVGRRALDVGRSDALNTVTSLQAPQSPASPPSFPLRSCVRIHKGLALRHELLPPAQTAGCLMDAVMEVDVQRKCGRLNPKQPASARAAIAEARTMRREWFRHVGDIARACPGQRLWFARDADARRVVRVISNM